MKKVRLYKDAEHVKRKYKFGLESFVLYGLLMEEEYTRIQGGDSFEIKYSNGNNHIILYLENNRVVSYELGVEMNGS